MSTTLGYLVGQAGEFSGVRVAIPGTGLIIGRDPSQVDVVFRHTMVSRRHAQIAPDKKGRLYLIDLESRNGTCVNGRKITAPVPLNAGDKVDFGGDGKVVFVFESADTPSVTGILNQIFGENVASVDWKVGDTILDTYEVLGVLGQGGFGKVYKVRHKSWNVDLAVKSPLPKLFSDEKAVEDFVREAETWVSLNLHPNIVQCFYVRTIGGIPRIFAEFVPGGSLHEWIEKRKLTQLDQILDVAIQFAWGLHAAHEQGLVHQDVKPLNVLMMPDGTAKVSDFGLARARRVEGGNVVTGPDNMVTMAGLFTQAYCSPEQVQGLRLSRKTDIWSFAVSLLQMFAGKLTWQYGFQAGKVLEAYQRLFGPKLAVKMPKQLAKLLARCFKLNPDDRPKDMLEVAAELQAIFREMCGRVYPRPEPAAVTHLADSLNNRGVSMLDLGRKEEAEKFFEEALKSDPHHPEANFNLGITRWRAARITDVGLVSQLEEVRKTRRQDWRADYVLGLVQMERGDLESAVPVLQEAAKISGRSDVQATLSRICGLANNSARCVRIFKGHTDGVWSVSLSADGRWALAGNRDKTLRLWEVATGQCVRTFEGHTGWVGSVCLSADGRWALSGSMDKTLRLWEVATGQCVRTFEGHSDKVTSVNLSADGRWALSGSQDKTLRLWEIAMVGHPQLLLKSFAQLSTVKNTEEVAGSAHRFEELLARAQAALQAGQYLHARHLSNQARSIPGYERHARALQVWNALLNGCARNDLRAAWCVCAVEGHTSGVWSVSWSADGRLALSGGSDRTLRLWEVFTGRCVRTFEGHTDNVASMNLSKDSRWGLSGSWDQTLRLWEVATGRCVRTFEGHTDIVTSVCFSADGRWAFSGSWDKTLRLWEVATGRCVRTFEGHANHVWSVNPSVDGRWGLSGGRDKTLRLWEVATGRCARTFEGHRESVTSASLSADGRCALSGSQDKTLRLWELDWDFEPREPVDWDEAARPHLINFLTLHTPYAAALPTDRKPSEEEITLALTHRGKPVWTDDDFKKLLWTLSCASLGWLRPEGVQRELEKMAAECGNRPS